MTARITSIVSILAPSSHEHQPEDDYCLPEEVHSRRDESNTGTYQDLSLHGHHGLHALACTVRTKTLAGRKHPLWKGVVMCMLLLTPLLLNHLVSMLNGIENTLILELHVTNTIYFVSCLINETQYLHCLELKVKSIRILDFVFCSDCSITKGFLNGHQQLHGVKTKCCNQLSAQRGRALK